MNGMEPQLATDDRPGWLVSCWPRAIRFLAMTIEQQPADLRDAIHEALDHGDLQRIEYDIDEDRKLVVFGFAGVPLCHVSFDALIGIPSNGTTH